MMNGHAASSTSERRRLMRRARADVRQLIHCGAELIDRRYGEGASVEIADLLPQLLWKADIPTRGARTAPAAGAPLELLIGSSGRLWDIGFRLMPGLEEGNADTSHAFARRCALRLLETSVPRSGWSDAPIVLTRLLDRFDRALEEMPLAQRPGLIALDFLPARAVCAVHLDLSGWPAERRWPLLADLLARSAPCVWRSHLAPMWRASGAVEPTGFGIKIGQDGIVRVVARWRLARTLAEAEVERIAPGCRRSTIMRVFDLLAGAAPSADIGLETGFAPQDDGVESALLTLPADAASTSPENLARAASLLGVAGPAPLLAYARTRGEPARVAVGHSAGALPRLALGLKPRPTQLARAGQRDESRRSTSAALAGARPTVLPLRRPERLGDVV